MLDEDCTIDEAAEILENDESDNSKLVVYDKRRGKGFMYASVSLT